MKTFILIIISSHLFFVNCETANKENLGIVLALLNATSPSNTGTETGSGNNSLTVDFAYSMSDTGAGIPISITPTSLQPATGLNFSVSPSLPAGLSLNSATGAISGTPTLYAAKIDYDITGQINQSSKTLKINFGVSQLTNDRLSETIPSRPIGLNLTYNVTGQLIQANPIDACAAIQNNVTGKVVLVRRGTCGFQDKVLNAQTVGAIAVIHYDNNVSNNVPIVNPYPNPNLISIPTTIISGNAGTDLVDSLATFNTNATLRR